MMARVTAAVVPVAFALALAACAASGTNPSASADGSGGSDVPATALGTMDVPALEAAFDTDFTSHVLTESKRRYTADFKLPLGVTFTTHPDDEQQQILETSVRISTDRPEPEVDVERAWFRLVANHQPEVLAWIREQRDQYLAEPGPDASIRRIFGQVCAGFFAFGAETSPTGKATTMGYFVETRDAHINCQGD
jgi:hypothetical protein